MGIAECFVCPAGPVAKFWLTCDGEITPEWRLVTGGHGHTAHYRPGLAAECAANGHLVSAANVNDTKQGDDIDNVVTSGPKCAKYNKWTEGE